MIRGCSLSLILVCLLAGPVVAQPPEPGQRGAGAGASDAPIGPPRAAAELVGMLDAYAIVQVQKALELPDERYTQFIPRLKKLQEIRRRNQQMRNRQLGELRRLVGPRAAAPPDENAVRDALKALREQEERGAAELRAAYAAVDEMLDTRRQARFRLFEEHMENRKLDLLLRARARANQRGTSR